MKLNFTIIIAVYAILISSCGSASFNVVNVKQADYDKDAIIYSLPKTAIKIKIEIYEIHKQSGPFRMYAKKFFGTEDVIKTDQIEYKISKVSMETVPIPDIEQNYAVIPGEGSNIHLINLSTEGYITGVNLKDIQIEQFTQNSDVEEVSDQDNGKLSYADLSVWSAREAKYDTLYREVFQDSVFVKMPIVKKTMVYKTTSRQAEELANQIFLLRDDRNALLKGEGDGSKMPDGEALKFMIIKLDKLEKEYMNLFTGKTNKIKKFYNFTYIPDKDKSEAIDTLFKFSRKYGVIPVNDEKGIPIILRIIKEDNKKNVENFVNLHKTKKFVNKQKQSGIFYRIPEGAIVEVINPGSVLSRKNFNIAQFGSVNILPVSIFKNNIRIEFYPELGSLKSISRDETMIIK